MKKVAIVAGASRGIGRAVAKRLARDSFAVVVNYLSNVDEAEGVVAEIKGIGNAAVAVKADVSSPADVERLFNETSTKFGSVDVVVHNSGIMPLSPIGKNNFDLFDKVISTNLRGAFLVLAQAAQHLASGGRIIAFSSSVLAKSFPTYGPYIASKAGVEGLVHVLANELRGRNVTVNAVAPGPVATELFLKGKSEEQIAELSKMPPLERLAQPEDIARDRKSTRLNSSHRTISYAVFCLKKKKFSIPSYKYGTHLCPSERHGLCDISLSHRIQLQNLWYYVTRYGSD